MLRRSGLKMHRSALKMQQRHAAGIAWKKLGFDFTPTKSMLRYNYANGEWDGGVLTPDFDLKIHALSNALHYGQAIFEGLKVFHCADGKVRAFNSQANAARLHSGCMRLHMPLVPREMFDAAIDRVVSDNVDYVPPFGSGGAMYLRPNLFGHGAKIGLGPAPEYAFVVVATPVGAYYKGGARARVRILLSVRCFTRCIMCAQFIIIPRAY